MTPLTKHGQGRIQGSEKAEAYIALVCFTLLLGLITAAALGAFA